MKLFKLLSLLSTSATIGSTATVLVANSSINNNKKNNQFFNLKTKYFQENSVEQGQSYSNSNTYYYSFTSDSAKEIINEIVNKNFTVPNNTNPDTSNLKTIKTIKIFLQKNNFKLTNADLNCITLDPLGVNAKLQTNSETTFSVVAKVGTQTAFTFINVKLSA